MLGNVQTRLRSDRQLEALLFFAAVVVFLGTGSYTVQSIDTAAASDAAGVVARTGSFELSTLGNVENPWVIETDAGTFTNRFPGVVLYSVPAYLIADSVGWDFRWGPGVVSASLVSAAATALMFSLLLALQISRRVALAGTLFFGFGTATWAVSADAQWPHGIDQLLIVGGLRLMASGRSAWAGLVIGFLAFSRPQLAPAILVIGVTWAWWEGGWRRLVGFGVPAVAGISALIIFNGLVIGVWSPDNGLYEYAGLGAIGTMSILTAITVTLFHPFRGVLILYPALLVCASGATRGWKAAPSASKAALLGGLVALLTQLALNNPYGGDTFFGSRLTIEALTLAYPFLVVAWTCAPERARRFGVPLLGISVMTHAVGAVVYPFIFSGFLPLVPATAATALTAATAYIAVYRAISATDDTKATVREH